MLEKDFQKIVKKRLDALDNCYYFVKEAATIRGIPDIVGCRNGHFFALEVKKSRSEAQKNTGRIVLQKHTLRQIGLANGLGYIVHPENLDDVLVDLTKCSDRKACLSLH